MDSTDDDFGELYVDVKVPPSPLVVGDCAPAISDYSKGFESQVEMKKSGVVDEESSPCLDDCVVNQTEANEESEFSYSDSDDDLNIVVRDDDSKSLTNSNNGVDDSQICSFQRPWTRNLCTKPNGRKMDIAANNTYIDPLELLQCGYSFSHTWSRMNVDVLEKKPWRNPGTDINDFFNFGFDEESWKDYCKPLGRAIEVGGGTLERIPSAELNRPRDSDPDVVIQIPVTTDVEELSPVEARSTSITSVEGFRSEGLDSSNDSVKEEALGCQDENTGSSSGEQSPSKENCSSREATPSDKEMVDKEKEENSWSSDASVPSSEERESSLADRIRLSPTPSSSVGKSKESDHSETESSKDSDIDDQREVSTSPRRTRFTEHEAIRIRGGERSGTENSRDRRSHEYPRKRHFRRIDYVVHRRTEHRIVRDASPSPGPDHGKKMRYQHGSLYHESSKNWQNRRLSSFEKDDSEGKGFAHSNRESCHGRLYSSVDHGRHRDRRFDWHNNEESSRQRRLDHSNDYKYEAHLKEYTSRTSFNLNQRNSSSRCKEEEDRYGRQHCERKYGHERSHALSYESDKERDRYDWLGEPYYQDRIPIADMDYRYRFEYSSAHGRHNPIQTHENDLHCRRRGDYDYNLHRQRYEDGVHKEESGIPYELAYREMHSFDELGRREFQMYGRNEEFREIDKRHRYTPDRHLDRFVSEKDGYKHRVQDAWPSQSLSLRDSWYSKGARDDSWRDDTRDFKRTEAYDRQNNQLYKAAPRDGWTRNRGHSDHVSIQDRLTYDNDWVRPDRGRYKSAGDIQCSTREVIHSEYPSHTDETLVRDIRMPTHNRMSTKQSSGHFQNHTHTSDHRSKKLRVGGNAFIKSQDTVDFTGRQGKLPNQPKRRFSNGGDTIDKQQDQQKLRKVSCRNNEKTVKMQDLKDKEEGEIIDETSHVKGIEITRERIQESLKKMEKRRERFKDTEFASGGVVATLESQTKPGAKSNDIDQQRPIRKRRWCATTSS